MIYQAYEAWSDAAGPLRVLAGLTAPWLRLSALGPMTPPWWPHVAAALELVARTGLTHRRPPFGIDRVRVADRDVAVHEEVVDASPFATLRRFRKAHEAPQPRVLLVAPMSGHFPTLLRGTVRTMLPEHDVYLTDWHNARDVEVAHGAFGLDEFIDHVMRFLRALGPGAHVVAVCQPCVAVLAAVALMAEDGDPATPRTLTLMAGPVDTRVNPTRVNALATGRSLAWFRRHLIGHVPWRYRGARRLVYPGFVQLAAFMSMNLGRHVRAHADLYRHLARGDAEKARATRAFYDEYFAVTDLPAEFYLDTVQQVFQEHRLPLGTLAWRGRRVDPGAIRDTTLFTVEGEKDDICAVGQTVAAHDLCTGLPPARRRHHVQGGAGHYGVFAGSRWEREIYPQLRDVIRTGPDVAGMLID
jgi:poly(3-hydroxybutyrate) depolymerase